MCEWAVAGGGDSRGAVVLGIGPGLVRVVLGMCSALAEAC